MDVLLSDWRLKDDDTMENEVFSMLTDLEDDLQQGKQGESSMPLRTLLTLVFVLKSWNCCQERGHLTSKRILGARCQA